MIDPACADQRSPQLTFFAGRVQDLASVGEGLHRPVLAEQHLQDVAEGVVVLGHEDAGLACGAPRAGDLRVIGRG